MIKPMLCSLALVALLGCTEASPNDTEARIICKRFVTDQLKAPSSAQWSSLPETTVSKNGYTFRVLGWVDAQNNFGAQVRSNYNCLTTYSSNGDWKLDDLNITPR